MLKFTDFIENRMSEWFPLMFILTFGTFVMLSL